MALVAAGWLWLAACSTQEQLASDAQGAGRRVVSRDRENSQLQPVQSQQPCGIVDRTNAFLAEHPEYATPIQVMLGLKGAGLINRTSLVWRSFASPQQRVTPGVSPRPIGWVLDEDFRAEAFFAGVSDAKSMGAREPSAPFDMVEMIAVCAEHLNGPIDSAWVKQHQHGEGVTSPYRFYQIRKQSADEPYQVDGSTDAQTKCHGCHQGLPNITAYPTWSNWVGGLYLGAFFYDSLLSTSSPTPMPSGVVKSHAQLYEVEASAIRSMLYGNTTNPDPSEPIREGAAWLTQWHRAFEDPAVWKGSLWGRAYGSMTTSVNDLQLAIGRLNARLTTALLAHDELAALLLREFLLDWMHEPDSMQEHIAAGVKRIAEATGRTETDVQAEFDEFQSEWVRRTEHDRDVNYALMLASRYLLAETFRDEEPQSFDEDMLMRRFALEEEKGPRITLVFFALHALGYDGMKLAEQWTSSRLPPWLMSRSPDASWASSEWHTEARRVLDHLRAPYAGGTTNTTLKPALQFGNGQDAWFERARIDMYELADQLRSEPRCGQTDTSSR